MNVPKLRFGEFATHKLKNTTLGSLTKWSSGGTPSKDNPNFWDGDIPWISASTMRGFYYSDSETRITLEGLKNGSKLAEKGNLLLLVRGSMLFNKIPVGITARDLAFNQDVKSLKPSKELSENYLLQWFQASEHKLLSMVIGTGIGAGKLETSDVQSMDFLLPSKEEQQKIADFLSAVDEKITALTAQKTALTQYKQGMMQRIFSQTLRFKDDNGVEYPEWDIKTLGELAKKSTSKNKDESVKTVFTNSAVQGIVNQLDFFDKDIANQNNLANYYIVEKNDFVYNPRISKFAPVGPIKRNHLGTGVMSPLYTVFRFNEGNLGFMSYLFDTAIWHDYMFSIANFGVRFDRMNISQADFFEMPIAYPCIEEQTKIAQFLTELDDKINAVDAQILSAQQWKQGLLQQMFI